MKVSQILTVKGDAVHSVKADDQIADAVKMLNDKRVGALLVLGDAGEIAGIISERDVVRGLGAEGVALLQQPISSLMTKDVVTCDMDRAVDDLMRDMTDHRIRHLPVVENGKLAGIISIGDVVKYRVNELEDESNELREYIQRG